MCLCHTSIEVSLGDGSDAMGMQGVVEIVTTVFPPTKAKQKLRCVSVNTEITGLDASAHRVTAAVTLVASCGGPCVPSDAHVHGGYCVLGPGEGDYFSTTVFRKIQDLSSRALSL